MNQQLIDDYRRMRQSEFSGESFAGFRDLFTQPETVCAQDGED